MSIPFGHHHLYNRYRFTGDLELVTALHVSSGRASDETDSPFIKTLDNTPFIPGSSLRGAIRSEIERILGAVGEAADLTTCTLFTPEACEKLIRDCFKELEKQEETKLFDERKTADELLAQAAEENLCDVCRLFGSAGYATRLFIYDAMPIGGGPRQPQGVVRDGVGIDRDTGAAREGVKFDYEVIESGPLFLFEMVAENVTPEDRKLLNLILALLKDGLHVGAKRGSGLGLIRLAPRKDGSPFHTTGFDKPEMLWQALSEGKPIEQTLAWQEDLEC